MYIAIIIFIIFIIISIFLWLIVIGSSNKNILMHSRKGSNVGDISMEEVIKKKQEQMKTQKEINESREFINIDIDKTLIAAIEKYGVDSQLNIAIEEMSELIKEICKNKRGNENKKEIVEEIADVYIMLEQLRFIFNINDDEIISMKDKKIKRLEMRLKQ